MIRTGDKVVLGDGGREKTFVVLGFTKFDACLANKSDYDQSMERFGEYNKAAYGYRFIPLKSTGVQMGFWKMLKSVNGKDVAK